MIQYTTIYYYIDHIWAATSASERSWLVCLSQMHLICPQNERRAATPSVLDKSEIKKTSHVMYGNIL